MNHCLNSMNKQLPPPPHTQAKIPCCTCGKFDVCSIREDMLKTAYLVQQIMGEPEQNYSICEDDLSFFGHDFEDTSIFPEEINATDAKDKEVSGKLMAAKFKDKDHIKLLYNINDYHVMFAFIWDEKENKFTPTSGRELYYSILYSLSLTSADEISAAALAWREEMLKKEEETKDADVINTTYFSASLNCDFYDYQRGLTEEQGWRRIELQYKDKVIPNEIEHLLTYHIEPCKVPFNNLKHTIAPMPALYPIYLPKPPCPPPHYPPCRRDDIND